MRWRSNWSPTTSASPPRSSRHRGSRMVQDGIGPHFLGWLDSLGDGAIAVIAHKNGDMDTIASATVLASMIGPRARATGIHVDKTSSRMLARTGMAFRRMDPRRPTLPRSLSGIVAVDAGGHHNWASSFRGTCHCSSSITMRTLPTSGRTTPSPQAARPRPRVRWFSTSSCRGLAH